jgi:hypothetical protein
MEKKSFKRGTRSTHCVLEDRGGTKSNSQANSSPRLMPSYPPPSSRPELLIPYRNALLTQHREAIDLSARLAQKNPHVSAGEGASLEDMLAAMTYDRRGDEARLTSLVIVDDVLASGNTSAAVIQLLRDAGLSQECQITLGCPLWLLRPTPQGGA